MKPSLIHLRLAGVGLALAVLVLFFFDPVQSAFYPRCLLHSTTGLLCPGCGSLRAAHQLLHGHLAAAFRFNPLLVLALPLLLAIGIRLLVLPAKVAATSSRLRPVWVWSLFAVVLAFGILRNLPLPFFSWLEP